MRYNRYLYMAVVALVVFVLYIIVNLLPIVRYMGNPRSDGLFGGILLAGRAEDDEAGQINAEVPRSQMGAAERKRRRELAKEWAEKHHWAVAEEKAEESVRKKQGGGGGRGRKKNPKVGRFETDENGHYKWAGPRPETVVDYVPILNAERPNITKEMAGYKFATSGMTLADMIPEEGGRPIRAVISTTWRSGSTFLGDVLLAHPATYYHYEPLIHYGIKQVRSGLLDGLLAEDAVRVLKNVMNCDYSELEAFIDYARVHREALSHNKRLWKYCDRGRNSDCFEPELLNRFCSLFPFQTMKTVRLRVNLTRALLEDDSLNVRVLLLVRDPRGTMQSRGHRKWCAGKPDCDDPEILCQDLVDDHDSAKILLKQFPSRFRVIRYEDFAKDPTSQSQQMLRFLGFQMHPDVRNFLETHTTRDMGGVSSTFRDSKSAPYHWMKDLAFDKIAAVQGKCAEAMKLWGYRSYASEAELDSVHPVDELTM